MYAVIDESNTMTDDSNHDDKDDIKDADNNMILPARITPWTSCVWWLSQVWTQTTPTTRHPTRKGLPLCPTCRAWSGMSTSLTISSRPMWPGISLRYEPSVESIHCLWGECVSHQFDVGKFDVFLKVYVAKYQFKVWTFCWIYSLLVRRVSDLSVHYTSKLIKLSRGSISEFGASCWS